MKEKTMINRLLIKLLVLIFVISKINTKKVQNLKDLYKSDENNISGDTLNPSLADQKAFLDRFGYSSRELPVYNPHYRKPYNYNIYNLLGKKSYPYNYKKILHHNNYNQTPLNEESTHIVGEQKATNNYKKNIILSNNHRNLVTNINKHNENKKTSMSKQETSKHYNNEIRRAVQEKDTADKYRAVKHQNKRSNSDEEIKNSIEDTDSEVIDEENTSESDEIDVRPTISKETSKQNILEKYWKSREYKKDAEHTIDKQTSKQMNTQTYRKSKEYKKDAEHTVDTQKSKQMNTQPYWKTNEYKKDANTKIISNPTESYKDFKINPNKHTSNRVNLVKDSTIILDTQNDRNDRDGKKVGHNERTMVTDFEFGYMVAVLKGAAFLCAGALVDENWVLTAADNVYLLRDSIKFLRVRLGSINYKKGGTLLPVKYLEVHPYFDSRKPSFDLALIMLSRPVRYTAKMMAIRLQLTPKEITATHCIVTSWPEAVKPFINRTQSITSKRQLLSVSHPHPADSEDCAAELEESGAAHEGVICLQTGMDACARDIGAPVVINGVLQGIISSWNPEGCDEENPALVFATAVSARNVSSWIHATVHGDKWRPDQKHSHRFHYNL